VQLNGTNIADHSLPQSFITIDREWKNGDDLLIDVPLTLRIESMPDNPNRIAIFNGPILLAGDFEWMGASDLIPVLVTEKQSLIGAIVRQGNQPLTFQTHEIGWPSDVILKPFYLITTNRSTAYWKVTSEAAWQQLKAEYEAEQQARQRL